MTSRYFNERARWALGVKTILECLGTGESLRLSKIPLSKYSKASNNEQIRLLRTKIKDVFELANVQLDSNLHCFAHDDRNPSLVYYAKRHGLHCFACMEDPEYVWDIFDLIGFLLNVVDFKEKRRLATKMFVEKEWKGVSKRPLSIIEANVSVSEQAGTSNRFSSSKREKMKEPKSLQKSTVATKGQIYKPFSSDPQCMDFLSKRVITYDTATKFRLKWWEHPKTQDRYLVIPCMNKFVSRRRYKLVNGVESIGKYSYPKNPDKLQELRPSLFNGRYLDLCTTNELIFVVESAMDALLIEQMGFHAVAINGKDNYELILEQKDIIRQKGIRLVILLDNDQAGKKFALKIALGFKKQDIPTNLHLYEKFGTASYLSSFKDIGEAYTNDIEETKRALMEMKAYIESLSEPLPQLTEEERNQLIELSEGNGTSDNPLAKFGVADSNQIKTAKSTPVVRSFRV